VSLIIRPVYRCGAFDGLPMLLVSSESSKREGRGHDSGYSDVLRRSD